MDADSLASYETYLIGCDGVLWGVPRLTADRAVETVNALLAMDKRVLFLTNDSSMTRKACVARLERLRIRFGGRRLPDRLAMCITSAHTTALYLTARGLRHPFVLASDGAVLEELRAVGIDHYHATVLDSGEPRREFVSARQDSDALSRIIACPWARKADCVVVTADSGFSARKVAAAVTVLAMADEAGKPGLPLIACAGESSGLMGTSDGKSGLPIKLRTMGNGAMAESISRCFDPPRGWLDLGKPSDALLELVTHGYRVDTSHALLVGDGLATDVVFGNKGRMATLLVLSGSTTRAQADEAVVSSHPLRTPTYVLPELGAFAKELGAMAKASGASS
jgi:4-nitrophenyl phosphatase